MFAPADMGRKRWAQPNERFYSIDQSDLIGQVNIRTDGSVIIQKLESHISLVFREMWDSTALALQLWSFLRPCRPTIKTRVTPGPCAGPDPSVAQLQLACCLIRVKQIRPPRTPTRNR
jgi:hypothetical protein